MEPGDVLESMRTDLDDGQVIRLVNLIGELSKQSEAYLEKENNKKWFHYHI
jgi:hypothetical protein